MPTSERISGKSGLTLTFGGVDYACDSTSVSITSDDADQDNVTFCEAAAGGSKKYIMTISAISTTVSGSFWRYAFANAGTSGIAYVFNPWGLASPTVDKPNFTGTLTLPGGMPALNIEAGSSTTFEIECELDGKPTLVTS